MLTYFRSSPSFVRLEPLLQQGKSLLFEGLSTSGKALLTAFVKEATGRPLLFVTTGPREDAPLLQDLPAFGVNEGFEFPAWETLPSDPLPPSPDIIGERLHILSHLEKSKAPFVVASLQAVLQKVMPLSKLKRLSLQLKTSQTIVFGELVQKLQEMGYEKTPQVVEKGTFAVRGGIIDIFPGSTPDPYRLEFWGDELTSLRIFDAVGQKSIRPMDEVEILPAKEMELLGEGETALSLLDYLGPDTLVVLDDLAALEDKSVSLKTLIGNSPFFISPEAFFKHLKRHALLFFTKEPIEELSELKRGGIRNASYYSRSAPPQEIEFECFSSSWKGLKVPSPFFTLQEGLKKEPWEEVDLEGDDLLRALENKQDYRLEFLCQNESEEAALQRKLSDLALRLPHKRHFSLRYLSSGIVFDEEKLILFPITELTHRYKLHRPKQRSNYSTTFAETHELKAGDLVVHFHHGIGKFLGVEKRANNEGIVTEFYLIEYAEHGKLYVPFAQGYLLSRYIGATEEMPKLHTIGSPRWKNTREQTQKAVLGYAKELLDIYARREMKGGFVYPDDSPDMKAFEEAFPFVETEDQLRALREIKEDMTSSKAMDRLICGDVGYGKTEVAMRAAFKTVVDGGKQVALLAPTTVLALQHYETFSERMGAFPVRVALMSRFSSAKQIREALAGLEQGSVDILIGTHRIVSQDVKFKDLGLVIIDEEQRFGVRAKEALKKIKVGVDCLTLSATPIPRTLYLSLVKAKDLSMINSPPQDRLPIKTMVADMDPTLIKTAILRELSREGQVFYIHNRVETLFETLGKLKNWFPEARFSAAHGQMGADELDNAFHMFKKGQADILVATSLVENGIDIPNANTILIERADRFGLAELYQLRGRVGRWNRRAYAYFLVPKLSSLPELSKKRLQALAEASGYGGGMKLAMRDLELRGAGNILGEEQSGQVASIGFHLYCRMLEKTINALKGKGTVFTTEFKIELKVNASLPESYLEEMAARREFYLRFGEASTPEEIDAIFSEMQDRFGPAPLPVLWLYQIAKLKVFGERRHMTLLKEERHLLSLEAKRGNKTHSRTLPWTPLKRPEEVSTKLIPKLEEFLKSLP